MISDSTTFFLAFAAVFGSLAALQWKMHHDAKRLEFRIAILEDARFNDATAKKDDESDSS